MIIYDHCFLCERPLEPISDERQRHPTIDPDGLPVEDCLVTIADRFGVSVEESTSLVSAPEPPSFEIDVETFPKIDVVLAEIFKSRGLERLGGASTGKGWSSFLTFQRCWHAYRRRYLDKPDPSTGFMNYERPAMAVGSIIHVLLAVYYQRMIVPDYPLTPDELNAEMMKKANPELVAEGWRVFYQYALYYQLEKIQPLAIELDLVDPRTRESCRFDLVAFFPETIHDRLAGTYILEHKSAGRFDQDTLDGWSNDGEILGQVMLWERLGLSKRYGPLRGVIVNILGKQKEPRFHRTTVSPTSFLIEQHKDDLRRQEGLIHLAKAMNEFPRSRGNCINRWGRCDYWSECAGHI